MSDITVGITAYERPRALERCLRSLQRFYPQLPVEVLDTKGNLSAGRNELVRRCSTPLLCLVEDDMEFTAETRLEALREVLDCEPQVAGVGCLLQQKGHPGWAFDFAVFAERLLLVPPAEPLKVSPSGERYQLCDIMPNFGVFRTQVLRQFPWDEELHLAEHREWAYRLHKSWRVARCETCRVRHHRDRPTAQYKQARDSWGRFLSIAENKMGLKMTLPETCPESSCERPNIVVLAVAHSNTTITTRQIAALGWNLGEVREEYAEHLPTWRVNNRFVKEKVFDRRAAERALETLAPPWVIKDPRFNRTLPLWLPVFGRYQPLLLWLRKDPEAVKQSHRSRGADHSHVDLWYRNCHQYYDAWPWARLSLDVERIAEAAALLDPQRVKSKGG